MEAFFQPKLAVVLGCFFLLLSVCFALCSSRLCFCGSALLHFSPFSPIFLRQIQILSGYFKRGKSRREGHNGAPPWPFSVSEASSPPCQPQSRNAKQLLPAPRVLGRGVTSGWCLLGCAWEGDFCKGCAEHKRRI